MKLYFTEDSEYCYPLSHFKQLIKDQGLDSLTIYPAIEVKVTDTIYCKHYQTVGDKDCGRQCRAYVPRNGKSGACKNLGKLYIADYDKPKIISR